MSGDSCKLCNENEFNMAPLDTGGGLLSSLFTMG